MKKVLIISALLLGGCEPAGDRLVELSAASVQRSVSIYVKAVVELPTFSIIPGRGLVVEKSTQTVTYQGAGVYISKNGHILTAKHLFEHGKIKATTACTTDSCFSIEVLSLDPRRDLALAYSTAPVKAWAELGDPRNIKVGQEVIAVGNPLGLSHTVSYGIISAVNRDLGIHYNLTQSDTSINPGNSGGPLFNLNGELVGVNVLIISPSFLEPVFTGLGFSVSSAQIMEFLTRFNGIPGKKFPKVEMKKYITDELLHE